MSAFSVLFVIYGFIQLTKEDTELHRVCFAWGLLLKKEKVWFSAPQPFGMGIGFGEGIGVSPSSAASHRNSEILWVSWGTPGDCYHFLFLTVFWSLWFLMALSCVAGMECVQNRWTWIFMNSHFAESCAEISSLQVVPLLLFPGVIQ